MPLMPPFLKIIMFKTHLANRLNSVCILYKNNPFPKSKNFKYNRDHIESFDESGCNIFMTIHVNQDTDLKKDFSFIVLKCQEM